MRVCDAVSTVERHGFNCQSLPKRVPPELRWSVATRAALPCVACATPMQTLALFDVPVDRCPGHGIWFDVDEMAIVLLRSQRAVQPPPSSGFTPVDVAELAVDGTYLAANVGIEAAGASLTAGVEVLDVVAGGAEVAGSVAGSVLEAVLELIGGLLP